jgi:hypothetical protein
LENKQPPVDLPPTIHLLPVDIGCSEVVEVPSSGREDIVRSIVTDHGREGSHWDWAALDFTLPIRGDDKDQKS